MELCPCPSLLLLFLGIILGTILQIVAGEKQVSCNKTQFLNEDLNICCNPCPPGHYRKEECTHSTETLCLPCGNGTYSAKWNYASTCRFCYPCSQILVEKEPCSATKAAVCVCPDGYSCSQYSPMNVCQICEPLPPTSNPTESPPDMRTSWIIIGVGLFMVSAIVLVICLKTSLLKSFGRMIKNKRSSESIPQAETVVAVDIESVHKGPSSSLLKDGLIKMPFQEEGKVLNFPIQESDASQPGEFALLSK